MTYGHTQHAAAATATAQHSCHSTTQLPLTLTAGSAHFCTDTLAPHLLLLQHHVCHLRCGIICHNKLLP